MDKKVLAGIGIIAVGGIAVIMMSRSGGDAPMGIGSGGGAGVAPPVTKKETETVTETPIVDPTPIYNIVFESPGGFGGSGGFGGAGGFPDPLDTIADTLYSKKTPAAVRKVYASTKLPSYKPPPQPTKKEQITAETGFTTRTGGGERNKWIGGR